MRSHRSNRVFGLVTLAFTAALLAIPAGAAAQSVSPTQEQYEDGVLGIAAQGNPPNSVGGSSIGELPFTGLDLVALLAIGVGLLGAGFVIRRTAAGHGNS